MTFNALKRKDGKELRVVMADVFDTNENFKANIALELGDTNEDELKGSSLHGFCLGHEIVLNLNYTDLHEIHGNIGIAMVTAEFPLPKGYCKEN